MEQQYGDALGKARMLGATLKSVAEQQYGTGEHEAADAAFWRAVEEAGYDVDADPDFQAFSLKATVPELVDFTLKTLAQATPA